MLRLAGALLFAAILTAYFAPLRTAALATGEAVSDATRAGRRAALHRSVLAFYALRYGIAFDLAADIERIAYEEGIDPDLAFRLVRVESRFKERAVSPVGALGLTQLMPATAASLEPGIEREQIFEREINLRLGFRYLRWLLKVYDGNVEVALHAYNRGPGTVDRIRAAGGDPANGYADQVLKGGHAAEPYAGDGLVPVGRALLPAVF
jgi:soluble lytic murein transglycosylase-like protein